MERKVGREIVPVLIGDFVRALVDRPGFVKVNALNGKTLTVLEISAGPGDIGKIVGKGGRSATALRQILFAMGGKTRTRFALELLEPDAIEGMTGMTAHQAPCRNDVVRRRPLSPPNGSQEAFVHAVEHDPVLPNDGQGTFIHTTERDPVLLNDGQETFIHAFERDAVRAIGGLLERVVRELVDQSDHVKVHVLEGTQAVVYEIHVNRPDVPKVLGKRGQTIDAVRTITLNLGKKIGRHLIVQVVEPLESIR